jgi:hypothetical protein
MTEIRLPPFLLAAIANPGGGRVTMVLGAGCSFEAPTNLPLSKRLAEEAHRQLIQNGVIEGDDCADPTDLSCVADAVLERRGQQRELVEVLPTNLMRFARPNEGGLVAAALLLEAAVGFIVVLNYDLSLSNALAQLGAQDEVTILRGPEDHGKLGLVNLVYLHRNVDADPEDWIIRTAALESEWENGWEEVIARMALAGRVIVFAGLGTRVAVLLETVEKIRAAVADDIHLIAVDPTSRSDSVYATALGLDDAHYLQVGWSEFARLLAARVVEEQRAALAAACRTLAERDGINTEGAEELCERATALGLVGLGMLRAEWLLSPRPYLPARSVNPEHVADLLTVIGTVERALGASAVIRNDGLVQFWIDDRLAGTARMGSGAGSQRWLSLSEELRTRPSRDAPQLGIVSGFAGPVAGVSPPDDLIHGTTQARSIIAGNLPFSVLAADNIRNDPSLVRDALAA